MYLCLCHAISVNQIQKHLENGASSVEEVQRLCKAGTNCGCCRQQLEELVLGRGSSEGLPAEKQPEEAIQPYKKTGG